MWKDGEGGGAVWVEWKGLAAVFLCVFALWLLQDASC